MKEKQSQPSLRQVHLQKPHPPMRQVVLRKWRDGGRAPHLMAKGAAVVDGNVTYFVSWTGQICSYNLSTRRWSELPKCPYQYSGLAVVRGLLTSIGGRKGAIGTVDHKLLSIVNDKDQKWVEKFPPMPTKRCDTATVTTKHHLIVAGGESGKRTMSCRLNTVEVMDVRTLVWSTAASLPHPYSKASATICGDYIYMLGGFDKDGHSKSVLTCSLTKLLQLRLSDSVWHRITDIPFKRSTCAAVNGELVAIGGEDTEYKSIAAVHKYNPTTDSWDIISNMPTARHFCLVAVLPTNEMMVVGGYTNTYDTDKVEITSIQYS